MEDIIQEQAGLKKSERNQDSTEFEPTRCRRAQMHSDKPPAAAGHLPVLFTFNKQYLIANSQFHFADRPERRPQIKICQTLFPEISDVKMLCRNFSRIMVLKIPPFWAAIKTP